MTVDMPRSIFPLSRSIVLAFIHTLNRPHTLALYHTFHSNSLAPTLSFAPSASILFAPTPHSQLTREIRLRDVVLESFVPLSALQLIEERAQWDAMNDAWHIPGIEYAGNQVCAVTPTCGMCTAHIHLRPS